MTDEAAPQHLAPGTLIAVFAHEETTPGGIQYRMRTGKGRDVIRAQGMIGPNDPPMRLTVALIHLKSEFLIEGSWRKLTLEEIEDLSDTDFLHLLGASGSATKGKS